MEGNRAYVRQHRFCDGVFLKCQELEIQRESLGQRLSKVAGKGPGRYPPTVAANSATGCESPKQSRRKAPQNLSWRFFSSAIWLYGGRAWETFGSTGCLDCRFLTPRTAVTQAREKARGSSSNQGC